VQCSTGALAFFYRDSVRSKVKLSLYATINRTSGDGYGPERTLRLTWNQMQAQLKCCGVESYSDWFYSAQWPRHRFVPDSCCDVAQFKDRTADSMAQCGKSD